MLTAGSQLRSETPYRLVVMGVSGCGKTTVGKAFADRMELVFRDGDELHPAANIAKMTLGQALTDEDRWPWLRCVGAVLREGKAQVVGCSALRRTYRDVIRAEAGGPVTFIYLAGSPEVIAARMSVLKDHFMPSSLLASQFATLEPPGVDEAAIKVDVNQSVEAMVDGIVAKLAS